MSRAFRSAANIAREYNLTIEAQAKYHAAIIEQWSQGNYDGVIEVRADDLHALTFAFSELEFRDAHAPKCKRCKDPIGPDSDDIDMFASVGICFHCARQLAPVLRRLRTA